MGKKIKTYADLITKKNTTIPKVNMKGISIKTLKELNIGQIKKLDMELKKSKGKII